jgi:cytochrome c oxidase cbb3-type subunit 4
MKWMLSLLICKALAMQGVDVDMDINVIRGIILIVLIISFVGLWVWVWSRKRKPAFDEASMLPLEEDFGTIPDDGKEVNHVN